MHGCTGCCATSATIGRVGDGADVTISIRSIIFIQHIVFILNTRYVGLFWHGYRDEIRLWALVQKGGDIYAGTCLSAARSQKDSILPMHLGPF